MHVQPLPQKVDVAWLKKRLPDNIRCDGVCGVGGMGVVFRAYHTDWSIPLAVKVPHRVTDPRAVADFLTEAELWADLGLHPYIATLYYVRELEGKPCTFSELVESGGMDALLRSGRHRGTDETTTLSRIITMAASTAWGLSAAHAVGLVHCDFKPGNCLVDSGFTAKVTDFGLARKSGGNAFANPGGTPLYESPEQSRRGQLTAATDYWSWAATVFEMFTGSATWSAGAVAGAAFDDFMARGGKFPGFPRVPEEVAEILLSCFSQSPERRPQSFARIAERLVLLHQELIEDESAATKPDVELVAADSLNNRAVSMIDLGENDRAAKLLSAAQKLDPLHPEAAFNQFVIARKAHPAARTEEILRAAAEIDSSSTVAMRLLVRLLATVGKSQEAADCLNDLRDRAESLGEEVPPRSDSLSPVLATPMSGEDFSYHKERFHRLLKKATAAIGAADLTEASRYALMAADVPGFSRHPELAKLRSRLEAAG
jgi:serine/threonine protein kinase